MSEPRKRVLTLFAYIIPENGFDGKELRYFDYLQGQLRGHLRVPELDIVVEVEEK